PVVAAAPASETSPPAATGPVAAAAQDDAPRGSVAEALRNAEKDMYERVGGILRMLHDSMRELGLDRSLSDVANQINDAQGRLEHIATLTEQAANKVLNTVDSAIPEQ